MAKLSAHGAVVGTIDFATSSVRYMSDGKILRNQGHGWKLYGKVKPDFTPQEAYARRSARLAEALERNPATAAYSKAMLGTTGLCKRWKLHLAISMMPDDADGVWSEVCDGYGDNISMDLDDVVELCRLYQAMQREAATERAQ